MPSFKKLTIQDKVLFNQWVSMLPWASFYVSSEYVFENLYAWSNEECIQIRWFEHFAIIRCKKQMTTWYFPPVANHAIHFTEGISWIFHHDPHSRLIGITDAMRSYIPNDLLILHDDHLSEFIYDAHAFIAMKGSKYHRKRNLVSQFTKHYAYRLTTYHAHDRLHVLDLMQRYHAQGGSLEDLEPMMKAIDSHQELEYHVDLLWVGDLIVALSVGTTSIFEHGVVLFEKADIDYIGSYAAIATMFAAKHFSKINFITRQEDLGMPEIRASKLSYHPIKKDRKYAIYSNMIMQQLYTLYRETFSEDSQDYVDHFFLNQYAPQRCFYHMIDRKIISALHMIPKKIRLNGQSWEAPMVVAAATLITHRRQGHMRQVMEAMLHSQYEKQVPFVTLYPVNTHFYTGLGFSVFAYENTLNDNPMTCTCRLEQTVSAAKLLSIYQKATLNHEGWMERDLDAFRTKMDALGQEHYVSSLLHHDDHIIGYMIHNHQQVEELVLLNDCRPIIDGVQLEHVTVPSMDGNSAQMARLVHWDLFLNRYIPPASISADLSFCIIDPILSQNNQCIRLIAHDGQLLVKPVDDAFIHFHIQELTDIVIRGTDDERLQGLFPKRSIKSFDRY